MRIHVIRLLWLLASAFAVLVALQMLNSHLLKLIAPSIPVTSDPSQIICDILKMLPKPIIIDQELFKCVTNRQDCQSLGNKTLLRLALFSNDWNELNLTFSHIKMRESDRILFRHQHLDVFISKMIPNGKYRMSSNNDTLRLLEKVQYYFVPGDANLQIPDLRLLNNPMKNVTIFGCCDALMFENEDLYLKQLEYQHFIPCQHELALQLSKDNPESYLPKKRVIKLKFLDTLAKVRDAFYKLNVYPFLMFGTLLGWYRECDLIPHTTDIDLGVFSSEFRPDTAANLVKSYKGCKWYRSLGKINETHQYLYEIRLLCKRVGLDVFSLYSDAKHSWSGIWFKDRIYKSPLPVINQLCTAELHGHLFFVPCNVEAVLQKEYGESWRDTVHSSKFRYKNVQFLAYRSNTTHNYNDTIT